VPGNTVAASVRRKTASPGRFTVAAQVLEHFAPKGKPGFRGKQRGSPSYSPRIPWKSHCRSQHAPGRWRWLDEIVRLSSLYTRRRPWRALSGFTKSRRTG
jgi:hypothetical protein